MYSTKVSKYCGSFTGGKITAFALLKYNHAAFRLISATWTEFGNLLFKTAFRLLCPKVDPTANTRTLISSTLFATTTTLHDLLYSSLI